MCDLISNLGLRDRYIQPVELFRRLCEFRKLVRDGRIYARRAEQETDFILRLYFIESIRTQPILLFNKHNSGQQFERGLRENDGAF